MRIRAVAIAVLAVITAACSGSAASAPPRSGPSIAASTPSTHPSRQPISTGSPGAGSNAAIVGDELTLTPPKVDISKCADKECRFKAAWVLMVAMPGQTWTRGIIAP